MISIRHSPDSRANEQLKEARGAAGESNRSWLSRVKATDGLLLLGGNSVAHFRLRVAQSHLRSDLLPSFWSMAGILDGEQAFLSVPLDLRREASEVPRNNGIERCLLRDFDDPERFPNIAVLHFSSGTGPILNAVDQIRRQRSVIDLPSLMLPWLGFVWGAGERVNPLLEGRGLPGAAFVETVYGIAGIELTPGLSSSASCPEAIWQSAKWWRQYYEAAAETGGRGASAAIVPTGHYLIRQPEAAAVEHPKSGPAARLKKRPR